MSRGSHRINEERVCIDSLVQHLKGIEAGSRVVVQEEPNDPPDYWLSVGEHRFAVEVTSIVKGQGYDALCRSLLDEVKKRYESDSPVPGTYEVRTSRRPDIPKRGSKEWKSLVADAVATIKDMSRLPSGSEARLLDDKHACLAIIKLSDAGGTVRRCRIPRAKWEGESQEDLTQLINEAIKKKHNKIQNKGIMQLCPDVMLLFYDAYGYGDIEDATKAFSNVKGYEWIHSIYWAASFSDRVNILYPDSPGRSGVFLYSKTEAWRQRA